MQARSRLFLSINEFDESRDHLPWSFIDRPLTGIRIGVDRCADIVFAMR
jgi:hypothetical protein